MNINNCNSPQFRAIKIADTHAAIGRVSSNIEIFKLGREDEVFIQKLASRINFSERCKNMSEAFSRRWKKVFDYCLSLFGDKDTTTYLAMHNNKPCGIMNYFNGGHFLFLDAICAIPDENGKKVPFCGQTLFLQLFKDAQEHDVKSIQLEAIQDGPFDVISKYEKLGFKRRIEGDTYAPMVCNKYKIKEQLKELPFVIDYFQSSPDRVNLDKVCD